VSSSQTKEPPKTKPQSHLGSEFRVQCSGHASGLVSTAIRVRVTPPAWSSSFWLLVFGYFGAKLISTSAHQKSAHQTAHQHINNQHIYNQHIKQHISTSQISTSSG